MNLPDLNVHLADLAQHGMLTRQGIINGNCEVAQRVTAPNLSTTYQYGAVDRFAAQAAGTAVSAGTISQVTSSLASTSGHALRLAGVTLTGSGLVYARYRMESKDAVNFKNQVLSFGCEVYHDTGVAINYRISLIKPSAPDDYTTFSGFNGPYISVASGTKTMIKYENFNVGDATNGLEIEIVAVCGAVTTKNFDFAEWQLNLGATLLPFAPKSFGDELVSCQRYYEKSYLQNLAPGTSTGLGICVSTGSSDGYSNSYYEIKYAVMKRTTPTVILYTNSGTAGKWTYTRSGIGITDVTANVANASEGECSIYCNVGSSFVPCNIYGHWMADAEI